jgi:predicted outer membrane repeat protein
MKKSTLFYLITVGLLCFSFVLNAKNVYLSATGDDTNDGLSEPSAVKTLGRVHAIVATGDIIYVNGIIDIDKDPSASTSKTLGTVYLHPATNTRAGFYFTAGNWHHVTFKGTNNTLDGFVGNNNGRLFFIDGGTHGFENLFFKEGRVLYDDGGHALWLRNSNVSFKNCVFEDNTAARNPENPLAVMGTNGRGGALRILNGTTNFDNCVFRGNENTLGSGLFIEGGNITLTSCVFEDNDVSDINGSSGGAIYTWISGSVDVNLNISNTLFKGNQTVGEGGAIAMKNLTNRSDLKTNLDITNCAFIGNAGQRGGALILYNVRPGTSDNINIKNTTFFANHAAVDGGTICLWAAQPGSTFTMVNCTMAGNTTNGNAGHGAGIVSMNHTDYPTINLIKRIYNSIFDSNYSNNPYDFSDIWLRKAPGEDRLGNKELEIKNSFIGWAGTTADNERFPGNNINYCLSTQEEGADPVIEYVNAVGIVGEEDMDYYGNYHYAIPLNADAPGRLFGNAAYLTDFNIQNGDQFGKPWTIVDGKCPVGAIDITSSEFDAGLFDEFPPILSSVNSAKYNNDKIIYNNNKLSLSSGKDAFFTLYNLSGLVINTAYNQISIDDLAAGIYIVKVKVEGREFSEKIIK